MSKKMRVQKEMTVDQAMKNFDKTLSQNISKALGSLSGASISINITPHAMATKPNKKKKPAKKKSK